MLDVCLLGTGGMKWVEDKGYKLGDVMNAFRLTLVGVLPSLITAMVLSSSMMVHTSV